MIGRSASSRASISARARIHAALGALAVLLTSAAAEAQGVGCVLQSAATPSRQVLRCQDGLTIEGEAGASFSLIDRNRDGKPDGANLQGGALLIEVQPGSRKNSFQVLTPQAIAAVRGTQWAVEVAGSKTSVFVVSGRVAVTRPNGRHGVSLGPGEGVDAEPGTSSLTVKRWAPARANALLARFGRRLQ